MSAPRAVGSHLRCADGTRAFVKAVGAELNPDSPTLYRRDVEALGLLGLVGGRIGAHLAHRAHSAVDVGLPTLAAFRREESARFLAAAARRLGVQAD